MAGLTDGKVFFGILATGVINLIATLVALKLIELLGRRPLIIWPLAMIIVVMVALTVIIVVNVSSKKKRVRTDTRSNYILDLPHRRSGTQTREKRWPLSVSSSFWSSSFSSRWDWGRFLTSIRTKCLLRRLDQLVSPWPCLSYVYQRSSNVWPIFAFQ